MFVNKLIKHKSIRKLAGFTLIELIVVLLIGSILLAWGVPNYRDFKVRKTVTDSTNELVYTLNFARAEAIRRGQTVRVRAKGAARNWETGANTLLINVAAANERLADLGAMPDGIEVTQGGAFVADINFDTLGGLANGSSTELRVENTTVSNAYRVIQVLPSGSIKVVRP